MPQLTAIVAAELASGVEDILQQAAAVATGNQGDYIANGTPQSIYGQLQQGAARQACRRYADDPSVYDGFGKTLAEKACRPYLDDIGYGSPGSIKLPFRGGQCAVDYQVQGFWRTESFFVCSNEVSGGQQAEQFFSTEFRVPGPISGFSLRRITPTPCGGFDGFIIEAQTPNGPDIVFQFAGTGAVRREVSFRISALNPGTGSDDCGNPPPDIVDPTPPPVPGPKYEPFSPVPGIDIDIGVEINPDGKIDIDFGVGDVTIDPFGPGSDGGGEDPSPGDEGTRPPGDVGQPGVEEPTGPGGDAEGEAPEGKVLTGLKLSFASQPPKGSEVAPGVYRGACYVYMGTPSGLDMDFAGSLIRDGQFIFAERDNLTRWKVSANLNFSLSVTPFYADPLKT